jgi:hypothetical protein
LVQRGCGAHDEGNVELANSCFDQRALEHDNECILAWLWKAQSLSRTSRRLHI